MRKKFVSISTDKSGKTRVRLRTPSVKGSSLKKSPMKGGVKTPPKAKY